MKEPVKAIYRECIKLSDLIVSIARNKGYEAYYIFRPNGAEIEVHIKENKIFNESIELEEIEIEYFTSGFYKKIKDKY